MKAEASPNNPANELCTDAPSPIHFRRREFGGRNFSFDKWKRPVEEHRLSNLKIVGTVPVKFSSKAAATCMAIDQNESDYLLAGSSKGSIDILNLRYMHESREYSQPAIPIKYEHSAMINCIQWYSKDISMFATASQDGSVKFWDLNKQKSFDSYSICHPEHMHWNEISDINPLIAVSDTSSNVILIDLRKGSFSHNIRNKSAATCLRWYPSETILAIARQEERHTGGGNRSVISYFDIRNARKPLKKQTLLVAPVILGMKYTTDGRFLACFSSNYRVYILDALSLDVLFSGNINKGEAGPCFSDKTKYLKNFCIVEEGNYLRLAVPCSFGQLRWLTINIETMSEVNLSIFSSVGTVTALAYRTRYQQLFSATSHGIVANWSSEGERAKANLETESSYRHAREDRWSDSD